MLQQIIELIKLSPHKLIALLIQFKHINLGNNFTSPLFQFYSTNLQLFKN